MGARKELNSGQIHPDDDVVEQHIARRIRQLRMARGLTQQQVGEESGLSKGLLSKIENCNVSPPIGTLSKLAKALQVPIGEFFDTDDLDPGTVFFPRNKRQKIHGRRTSLNYEYELLVPGQRRRDMQPMTVSVDGKTYKFALQEHPGEQFILMREGSMSYVVGDKTYVLQPEDCLYFEARIPHGPKLHRSQKATYLVVFSGT